MKRRVARGPFLRIADLEDVLGRVLVVEMELARSPCLHAADPRAGRELAFDRILQEMHRGLDTATACDMDPRAMFRAWRGAIALAVDVLLGLIDKDEEIGSNQRAGVGECLVQLGFGHIVGDGDFAYAGIVLNLDEQY